jgi:hypothetical protein
MKPHTMPTGPYTLGLRGGLRGQGQSSNDREKAKACNQLVGAPVAENLRSCSIDLLLPTDLGLSGLPRLSPSPVVDEAEHSLEDAASNDDGLHHNTQPGGGQHNISGSASSIGGACKETESRSVQENLQAEWNSHWKNARYTKVSKRRI